MKFKTIHAPRTLSTAKPAIAIVNERGEDALVAKLVAEYAPHARTKAAKDKADAKAKADKDAAFAKVLAASKAYVARINAQ